MQNNPVARSNADPSEQPVLSPDNRECESRAIDLLRFFCVLFIIPLHCCFSHKVQIPPCGLVRNAEWFFCSFPSLDVLLFLSGFLFFRNVPADRTFFGVWGQKLRRRGPSLLVPYLLWTAAAYAANGIFRMFPEGMDPSRPADVLRWFVGWDGWRSHPGGWGLWYVKSLILAALLAPLYWTAFRLTGPASILIGLFLFIRPPLPIDHPLFSAPFFLGGALAFERNSLWSLARRTGKILPLAGLAFFGWMLCCGTGTRLPGFLSVVPYVFAASLFARFCDPKNRIPGWLSEIASASTFVYFAHFFVSKAVGPALRIAIPLDSGRAAATAYVLRVAGTTVLSILLFFAIRKTAPGVMAVLTGNRSRPKRHPGG